MLPPKTLRGPAVHKYFAALIAAEPSVSADAAKRLAGTLGREIAELRVRRPVPRRATATSAGVLPAQAAPPTEPVTTVDPFAFSLLAVLSKEGRAALETRLALIASRSELIAMAAAQHVALPSREASLADLRAAIVAGTERRLADRRAAAG
jgi:hypothetical protein